MTVVKIFDTERKFVQSPSRTSSEKNLINLNDYIYRSATLFLFDFDLFISKV
jgi:hypothetical protein